MSKIDLLDCTLRDGGYVNDWNFGHSVITGTYKRLDAAGIDYIEVGFLDDRRPFDINRSIMPDTESINRIYGKIQKKHAIPVAMIDFGTCGIENISDCDKTFIDGIRVIFKKEKIADALPFCKKIKDKGYKLFIQAISITAYSDQDMIDYIKKINQIKPYAFSIVDTYGLLDNNILTHYFQLIDQNLDTDIKIGYHAHNNFQLGFSNSHKFLSSKTSHDLIADSTAYGMGKSAGNCATELLAMHLNTYCNKQYDLNQILEIIDTDLLPIWKKHFWGYSYEYYISAMQKCHPDFVKFLLNKKTLSVSAVNQILSQIPKERKLFYNKDLIEQLYQQYQSHDIDDSANISQLHNDLQNKTILLLGPGTSLLTHKNDISTFITQKSPVVFSTNFYSQHFNIDYFFISNAKRYSKLSDILNDTPIKGEMIITSNIDTLLYSPKHILNYESLVNNQCNNRDNSLIMLLGLFKKIGVNEVYLAGFDGYGNNSGDYIDPLFDFLPNQQSDKNKTMSEDLSFLNRSIHLNFITPTNYELSIK